MERNSIPVERFISRPFDLFDNHWLLLTCGDFTAKAYNCMTISWGSLGILWGYPIVQTVVRPVRYTYSFMEKYPTFTLCAFSKEHRPALNLLGSKSGRDGDKIAEAGLTLAPSNQVAAPCFVEAELVFECQKVYWADLDPAHFLDPEIERCYPKRDYHRSYLGRIQALYGTRQYEENA